MAISKYLYTFSYDNTEEDLCKIESKYLFNAQDDNKLLLSDIDIEPSHSPFVKKRLEIILHDEDYNQLIEIIKSKDIHTEGFKVEYIVFEGDDTSYGGRLEKLKDIGYSIEGNPDYYEPTTTYVLCLYQQQWCFGRLTKDKYVWRKHMQKPRSYSNSININIAKAIVNIAAKGDKSKQLLDGCCGVGTVLLEACFAGYSIEGCDINWKVCHNARANLSHFNYTATVYRSDLKDIKQRYDAIILDLPYNLLSVASDDDIVHIINSAAEITDRMVIVSTSDISHLIQGIAYGVTDYCEVGKRGKASFARRIWVCEKK